MKRYILGIFAFQHSSFYQTHHAFRFNIRCIAFGGPVSLAVERNDVSTFRYKLSLDFKYPQDVQNGTL